MPTFALVDCNNFYASCEKLFRPDLKHRPLVVLSNNDGCVVARSKEAKTLGIKMGVPLFQIQDQIKEHGVITMSSNYALYGDMSARVMSILESLVPAVEVYSIDEAFLDLTGIESAVSRTDFGMQVRKTVLAWTGIVVCVGIAPTKTLAKLANHAAKRYPATGGVVDLMDQHRQQRLLAITPIEEVWGIGRRLSKQLMAMGLVTALDLAQADPKAIRRQFSVVLERTLRELNGESCIDLEEMPATKQQIVCSRSFGQKVTTLDSMRQAITGHVSRAAEKLRKEGRVAGHLSVFIRTSPFKADRPQYSNSASYRFETQTADTSRMVKAAQGLLSELWRSGFEYAKAGVMIGDFSVAGRSQLDMFDEGDTGRSEKLMSVLDSLNQKQKGAVFLAGQGIPSQRSWGMKQDNLSPAYTTRWSDLPRVR